MADVLVLRRRQLADALPRPTWTRKNSSQIEAPRLADEPSDRRELLDGLAHHDGVHLDGSRAGAGADRLERLGEVARDAADASCVAALGAVEADRGDLDPGTREGPRRARRSGAASRSARVRPEAASARGPLEQTVEAAALEHVAAGRDEHGPGVEAGRGVEEPLPPRRRQLAGRRLGIASARQCRQARPQAFVVSQKTSIGRASRSRKVVRIGSPCRTTARHESGNATIRAARADSRGRPEPRR